MDLQVPVTFFSEESDSAVTPQPHPSSAPLPTIPYVAPAMNLADVFTVTFILLGLILAFIAYWLMAAGLFPRAVARCADQLGRAPIKSTLIGAITFAPLVAIGLVISSKAPNGALKLIGIGLAVIAVLFALVGSAGLALRVGHGLQAARDTQDPWRRTLRGGIVLGLTFLPPFPGWVVVMPLALISGFGAMILSRPRRHTLPASAPAVVTPAHPEPVAVEQVPASATLS